MTNTFPSLKNEPLEIRLSAYLDGQTNEEDTTEIERLIAEDETAQKLMEQLVAGSEAGNQAFDEMLREPVPLHLVRAIKDAARKAEPVRVANGGAGPSKGNLFTFLPRAIAASAILLMAGGYAGFVIGNHTPGSTSTSMSEMTGFSPVDGGSGETQKTRSIDLLGDAKGIVAADSDALLANQWQAFQSTSTDATLLTDAGTAGLLKSLSDAAGVSFKLPDLSAEGYTFAGARLMADDGKPMAGLFYRDAAGQLVIIGYRAANASSEDKTLDVRQVGNATIAAAVRQSRTVTVIGAANLKHVDTLRDKAIEAL